MKIKSYQFQDVTEPGWVFDKVEFSKINLLVGDSATGKTRILNTIFNLGSFVAAEKFFNGFWNIEFSHLGKNYIWEIKTQKNEEESVEDSPGEIVRERLIVIYDNQEKVLIDRDSNTFLFNDNEMPKLSSKKTSISLLKEELEMQPIFDAFSVIMRRRFFHDALTRVSELNAIPINLIKRLQKQKKLQLIFNADMNLSTNLYLLNKYFPKLYKSIIHYYRGFFPFVQDTRIRDLSKVQPNVAISGQIPVFEISEKDSNEWVSITNLSSGMQKVLLILTDLHLLPSDSIYMIDEYENSLGISAIDFFPEFVNEFEKDVQLLITSHHPYLINEISPENWFIFHRKGMNVHIQYGKQLKDRFSKSKQQAFIQLITLVSRK
jgi:predicted ATPase